MLNDRSYMIVHGGHLQQMFLQSPQRYTMKWEQYFGTELKLPYIGKNNGGLEGVVCCFGKDM